MRTLSVALLGFVLGSSLLAQEQRSGLELLQERVQTGALASSPTFVPVPMDAPVGAETYVVGPGDVFAVNIWITPPIALALTVTPEGTLIIPTVGEVVVGARKLSEARRAVLDAIHGKYVAGNPTVTLATPRSVVVYVHGTVVAPGRYVVLASDRVDKAIRLANGEFVQESGPVTLRPEEELVHRRQVEEARSKMSERNIMLRRRDGSVLRIDLVRYRSTGDDLWNPSLSEGDQIIVPERDESYNSFGVYGGVNLPGRYEFVEGEAVLDAIALAGGFSARALRDSIVLARPDEEGRTLVPFRVFSGGDGDPGPGRTLLQPGDRVIVSEVRELRGDYHVRVEGEVAKPGLYPITRDHSRVSEVIGMAGGFTESALISAAKVYRRPDVSGSAERTADFLLSLQGANALEDTVHFRVANQMRVERELVSVDFVALFVRRDSSRDVVLRDGDRVVVPSRLSSVYVFGQVVSPGHVVFVPGSSVEYYVGQAGGYTDEAITGEVRIVKASSRQWLTPSETTVEDGDAIWVPKDVKQPFSYYMEIIGQAASVISVVMSMTWIMLLITKS